MVEEMKMRCAVSLEEAQAQTDSQGKRDMAFIANVISVIVIP